MPHGYVYFSDSENPVSYTNTFIYRTFGSICKKPMLLELRCVTLGAAGASASLTLLVFVGHQWFPGIPPSRRRRSPRLDELRYKIRSAVGRSPECYGRDRAFLSVLVLYAII